MHDAEVENSRPNAAQGPNAPPHRRFAFRSTASVALVKSHYSVSHHFQSYAIDPVTAASLAGTVVQLVDFSVKLISKSYEFYQSGCDGAVDNQSIEKTTEDLKKLNDQLKATIITDSDLTKLCKACSDAADNLLVALSKLRVDGKGRTWQSFRKALRSIWSKEEVQELEKRLARFRDELNLRLTAGLR